MHNKKEKGELFLQEPPEGPFDHKALQWHLHTAYIPYHRVKDFIQGEENRKGFPTKFHKCQKHENVQGSLKRRVDGETYLEKMCYHCSFGPDMGGKKKKRGGDSKEDSTDGEQQHQQQQQKEHSEEDGVKAGSGDGVGDSGAGAGEEEDGELSHKPKKKSSNSSTSKKRGCLCNFEVRKLYLQPSVARLTYECFDHVNPEGVICHGAVDSGGSGSRPSSVSSPEERERERSAVAAAHASNDHQALDFEAVSVSVAIPGPVPEHVATLVPEPVANPLQAEPVVVQSNPVVPVHFKSFEEMLRIESRLKAMLYNHPPLVVNYCALLEEIEGKLIEIITSKQNTVVAGPVVLPSPTNTVSTGLGLNVMDSMDQDSIPFKSMQYPPAPPVRFPSAAPAPGVDWLRIVDSSSKFSSEHIPPAPAPKNGSDHWKKFMGGRQQQQQQPQHQPEAQAQPQQPPSVASIYIPPAPPVRGNPGGYDWEKALAESSSRHSQLSHHQPSPSTLAGNAHAGGFGFGSSSKPVVVGSNSNSKHKPSSTTVIEIPPAPPFKANPIYGLNSNSKQAHAHDGNPKLIRKSAEQPISYAAPIKRQRPLIGVPSRAPEQDGVAYPFSTLPRPTQFLTGKVSVVRTSSDADEQRDTSEDTSST